MEQDESPSNVYALFPGIETTPFGRAAELQELSDEGWSTTVEPTIALDPAVAVSCGGSRRRRSRRVSATTATLVSIALVAGAGLAVVRGTLPGSGALRPRRLVAAVSEHRFEPVAGLLVAADHTYMDRLAKHASDRPISRHTSRATRPAHTSGTTTTAPAAPSAPEQTQTEPVMATVATDQGTGGGGSAGAGGSSSQASQRAGPSGPVSLIGAGTTPSG